jgi:hypothetical protein
MIPLSIRLILETNKEQNVLKVLARLKKLFDFELRRLAPYFKGGFEADIVARLDDGPWPNVVLRAIEVAQSFGKGWGIGGAVQDEIDLSASGGFAVPGIQFAWITASRNDRYWPTASVTGQAWARRLSDDKQSSTAIDRAPRLKSTRCNSLRRPKQLVNSTGDGLYHLQVHRTLRQWKFMIRLPLDLRLALKLFAKVTSLLSGASIGFKCLTGVDIVTTTPTGRFVLTIFAGLSQFERELTRERVMAGLSAARAAGGRAAGRAPLRRRCCAGRRRPCRTAT